MPSDDADWPAIWPFLHEIVAAGDTFSYDQRMGEAQARAMWMLDPPDRTSVAVEDGLVLGSANMYPNHDGPGAHVASGNFMVDSAHRGKGVGRALAEDMVEWARRRGFRAIQFNAVAESNTAGGRPIRVARLRDAGDHPRGLPAPRAGLRRPARDVPAARAVTAA